MVLGQATVGAYAFFSITFLACAAGILAVVFYFTPCKCDDKIASVLIGTSWCTTFIFTGLLFILAGIILPVSIVFSDSCGIIADIEGNLTKYGSLLNLPAGGAAISGVAIDPIAVLGGCLSTPSVAVAVSLNLSSAFTFDKASIFGSLPDASGLDGAFSLQPLDTLTWTVNNLTLGSFGLYQQNITDALANLNAISSAGLGHPYTEDDCTPAKRSTKCAPASDFSPSRPNNVRDAANTTATLVENKIFLNSMLTWMKNDVNVINAQKTALKANASALFASLGGIETSLDPLFTALDKVFTSGDCSFVGTGYTALQTDLCKTTLSGTTSLSLVMYVIAVLGIFTVIFASLMNNRLFGARGTDGTTVYPEQASSSAPAVY